MLLKALRNPRNGRRQRGTTIMEYAIWSILAALVIVGIFLAYGNASASGQTNTAMTELNAIQTGIRSVYAGQASYNGLAAADLISTKSIPNSDIDSAGTGLVHPFGDAVTIASANYGTGTDNAFDVTFTNLDPDVCNRLAVKDMGGTLVSVTIGTTAYTTLPVSPANAQTSCGTAATDVTWTFH